MTDDQILEILEAYKKENKQYAKIAKKTFKAYERVSAELTIANDKIAALSARPCEPSPVFECERCPAWKANLEELRSQYR